MMGSDGRPIRGTRMADMNDARIAPAGRAPWHLWLVGLLMVVWNAASCYSHVMTLGRDDGYFRATGITPEIAAYFAALPPWYIATWTVGVWGGLVAAVSLLMRKSSSVWWFAASQVAMAVNGVATLRSSEAREVLGAVGSIWAIATIILGAFLVFYSMAIKQRGILR
jgi:hypothetical protein